MASLTHSTAGEGKPSLVLLIGIHHAQLHGQFTVGVRDQGVGEVPSQQAVALGVCT